MTKLIGQLQGSSVSQHPKDFLASLKTLADTLSPVPVSEGAKKLWLECFAQEKMSSWLEAVRRAATFDHFPLPIEMRSIIENIEKEKIKAITQQPLDLPKALLPGKSEDYSEEYRQANLEFIGLLTSGLKQCLSFKSGESKSKEERREIWKDTETKVAVLQDRYQHLPSSYVCKDCWDSGWVARSENGYLINYPCRCAKGFERQKEIILSVLNDKAKQINQTLSQYLASLTASPFHMKAYPCIAVFSNEGKWDFACQHQCDPERIKWCFLKIDTITTGGG